MIRCDIKGCEECLSMLEPNFDKELARWFVFRPEEWPNIPQRGEGFTADTIALCPRHRAQVYKLVSEMKKTQ